MQKTSLPTVVAEQLERAAQAASGRSATSVHGGAGHTLRQNVIALTSGTVMDEHSTNGEATVQVLSGRVRISSGQDADEGSAGELLTVPAGRHSLEALETSAILLTVGLPDQPTP